MSSARLSAGLLPLALIVSAVAVWALTVGASEISAMQALGALWSGDDRAATVIRAVRLPRVIAALGVGAALAVAGAIMQAVTRNPMAEPGILGVNAGASFAVVLALAFGGVTAAHALAWFAFAGAGAASVLVYALGSAGRYGATPVKLVLSGVVVASFLASVTLAILLIDAQTFDAVRLWTAGSLRGRQLHDVLAVLPYAIGAIAVALAIRTQFTSMSLGAEVARGLGQNQAVWRAISVLIVALLAGSAVAMAGPVAFVGLVVPHMVRLCIGPDYGWLLPYSALAGALLTLVADTLPRAAWGTDVPVGISLALVGAPVFIWLARSRTGAVPA